MIVTCYMQALSSNAVEPNPGACFQESFSAAGSFIRLLTNVSNSEQGMWVVVNILVPFWVP